MLNFILLQLFSYSTYDIIIQNGFFHMTKHAFIAMSFYYDYLCSLLMKNIKNKDKQLNNFCIFIFVVFGIFLTLYLYSIFVVTFKTLYTLITNKYTNIFLEPSLSINSKLFIKNNICKYSILNELFKSKNYLFSI